MKNIPAILFCIGLFIAAASCGKNNPTGPGTNPTNTPALVNSATATPTASQTDTPDYSPTNTPTNAPTVSIGNAVDYNSILWWTVGPAAGLWYGTTIQHEPFGDNDSARSGSLSQGQSSYIEASITGPGDLSWYVMTDTEDTDYLRFYVDGSYTGLQWSGLGKDINFWSGGNYHLSAGSHTVRWEYFRNSASGAGANTVWVDRVDFAPDTTLTPAETGTATPTQTAADTGTYTATLTVTDTFTATLTSTDSFTSTITETHTDSPTMTASPTFTDTFTITLTPTNTPLTAEFRYGSLPDASYAGASDALLLSLAPGYNAGGCTQMNAASSNNQRSLLRFDISGISPGSAVVSARLVLTAFGGGTLADVNLYPVLKDWLEGTDCATSPTSSFVTFNTSGIAAWSSPGLQSGTDYNSTAAGSGTIPVSGTCTINLNAAVVQSWIDSASSNYGLLMISAGGNGTVCTKEHGTVSSRPRLIVEYYDSGLPPATATGTISPTPTVTETGTPVFSATPTITATATSTPTSTPTQDSRIVYVSDRDGGVNQIWVMNADGNGNTRVTYTSASDTWPSWSPDRNKIVFFSGRDGNNEIYVMDADGGSQVNISNNSASDNNASWSPDGTKIVFESNRDGNNELYVMDADGGNQTRLTNNLSYEGQPMWSPDGSKIAFYTDRDGNFEIYAMDADGNNPVNLSNNTAYDGSPSWSPDGNSIAFTSNRSGKYQAYTMTSAGASQANRSNNAYNDYNPVWSPDGLKLAIYSDRDGNGEVYTMNVNGSNQVNISNNTAGDYLPQWGTYWLPQATPTETPTPTPDTRIVFTSNRDGGNDEIYIMNSDGSGALRLTNNSYTDFTPAWSPDRNKIAYGDGNGAVQIYLMNPDGSGKTRLTYSGMTDYMPSWSPDGTKIAFQSYRDGNNEIYAMNSDGSGQVRLTNNPDTDSVPAWSPDGSKIAFGRYLGGTQYEVIVMDADGGNEANLSNNSANDYNPAWSSDGSKIAFNSNRSGIYQIFVMNSDGSGQVNISNSAYNDYHPSWSEDGLKISFIRYTGSSYEIFMMNADGSGQVQITPAGFNDMYPDMGCFSTFSLPASTPYPSATMTVTVTPTASATVTPTTTPTITPTNTPRTLELQYGTASYSGSVDTWIDESQPNSILGAATAMGICAIAGYRNRMFLMFDMSGHLNAGNTVISARLELYYVSGALSSNCYVFQMLRNWNENATWNTGGTAAWAAPGGAYGTDFTCGSCYMSTWTVVSGWNTIPLNKDVVQGWVNTPSTNYGIMTSNAGGAGQTAFYSKECVTVQYRPKLVIQYY